jgi:hypothetical protein
MADITLYRKDQQRWTFTLKRAGALIDLTGYTPWFSAKAKVNDSTYLFNKASSVITASEGICRVVFDSADTDVLCNNGVFEVTLLSTTGSQDTLGQYTIDIKKDVKTTAN